MVQKQYECDWCGKPAVVFFEYEVLCENCWKGAKIAAEDKKKQDKLNSVKRR